MDKWYKVLSKDLKAKDGGSFDYAPFVESKKWTPVIKDKVLCERGYHVTRFWNMFLSDSSNRVFEVEVKGLVEEKDLAGVVDKAVCSSLRIVCEFIPKFENDLNTGSWNTGSWNTGHWNTGGRNTGDWNTGDWNTGYSNTGNRNTGNSNTGNRNTGGRNTGNRNTGDRNTGHWNTGNWNTGSFHAGAFNTGNAEKVYLFNKEILKTDYDRIIFPEYFFFELEKDYRLSWGKSFAKATKEQVLQTINLPNFDYKVFEEITGITKGQLNRKIKKESVRGK